MIHQNQASTSLPQPSNVDNMSAKGSFSFKNDKICQTLIGDGILMRIERAGQAIARVYFVDDGFAQVDIPNGIAVHDNTNNIPLLPLYQGAQFFVLAWSDNYTITVDGVIVLDLSNQRQWALRGRLDREVSTIDA